MTFMAAKNILQKTIICQGHFSDKMSVPQKRRGMICRPDLMTRP